MIGIAGFIASRCALEVRQFAARLRGSCRGEAEAIREYLETKEKGDIEYTL